MISNERFLKVAGDPFEWLKHGRGLVVAAKVLNRYITKFEDSYYADLPVTAKLDLNEQDHEGYFCMDAFWLQAGFAIECFLKGIIVRDDPSAVDSNEFKIKTHKFLRLIFRAKLKNQITPEEALLLDQISERLVWSSRYPCPLKPEGSVHIMLESPGLREKALVLASRFEQNLASGYETIGLSLVPLGAYIAWREEQEKTSGM